MQKEITEIQGRMRLKKPERATAHHIYYLYRLGRFII